LNTFLSFIDQQSFPLNIHSNKSPFFEVSAQPFSKKYSFCKILIFRNQLQSHLQHTSYHLFSIKYANFFISYSFKDSHLDLFWQSEHLKEMFGCFFFLFHSFLSPKFFMKYQLKMSDICLITPICISGFYQLILRFLYLRTIGLSLLNWYFIWMNLLIWVSYSKFLAF
jgi:hypothetical protein